MLIVIASFFRKTFIHQRHIDIYLLDPNVQCTRFQLPPQRKYVPKTTQKSNAVVHPHED